MSKSIEWPMGDGLTLGVDLVKARRTKVGLYVLIGVISSLFFLLIVAFMARSQLGDWEHLSAPWQPLATPWPLLVNSVLLLIASVALQWARVVSRSQRRYQTALVVGAFFTICFVAGQLWVWHLFVEGGFYASANPANSFFYLLTGLHGLHLTGGMVALSRVWFVKEKRNPMQTAQSIELCAIYWHYLLILWLVLVMLLTASPEAFAAFAALCGL